jgi:predicted phosphoribosyltransferase
MGAIASAGASGVVRIINPSLVRRLHIPARAIDEATAIERRELERRERAYRGDRPPLEVTGRTVVVVDDGLATGATMLAAVAALREHHPAEVIVAVPIGSVDTCAVMRDAADECVCAIETHELDGVGRWYWDFAQTTDAEVLALLDAAGPPATESTRSAPSPA